MNDDQGMEPTDRWAQARKAAPFGGAFLVGVVLGALFVWFGGGEPEEREMTAVEVAQACAPAVETKVVELDQAQDRIAFLEKEVTDREAKVKELETKRSAAGEALVAKLAQAKRDLAEAQTELAAARQEKEQLVVQLTETKDKLEKTQVALADQVKQTVVAKEDALVNKWYRFVHQAELAMCERGTRKKIGECRETVVAALQTDGRRGRFAHCVRSGQAMPEVRSLGKDTGRPSFAEPVLEGDRAMKDWVVLFCDPSLPEQSDGNVSETPLAGAPGQG
jgi:hypothetical protein